MLKELIANFDGQPGLSKCFYESAISLLLSGISALKELSARGEVLISKEVIIQYTHYSDFCRLAENEFTSPDSKAEIQEYIKSRAGFDGTDMSAIILDAPTDLAKEIGVIQYHLIANDIYPEKLGKENRC